MTSNQLEWRALQPDTERFLNAPAQDIVAEAESFAAVQSRLFDGLNLLLQTPAKSPLMLIKSAESAEYLTLLQRMLRELRAEEREEGAVYGGDYRIDGHTVSWHPSDKVSAAFTGDGDVHVADWIEAEQLFGCVRNFQTELKLVPGLIHRANGGVLVLSVRTLLAQPLVWLRLKKIIQTQQFEWLSQDDRQPLPVSIPSMPLTLRLVLVGERDALADFQEIEPELSARAIYSEFEDTLQLVDEEDLLNWQQWVVQTATALGYTAPAADFWPPLVCEGARYTGDQDTLPLDPCWIARQLNDAVLHSEEVTLTGQSLTDALAAREWREGFLSERVRDEILLDQILVETQGEMVGQINALSVIEFPGHPRAFGEPSRISCVVHIGDGEFTDVERKAELGGNIHAKGMMIMQAWLMAELDLDQQLPFSASLVFEQSYSEVDGDSASLAELCALISALAGQPIYQHLAVTGSVDQFGRVQPVGGLNEKIEGFFHICQQRELTGNQGVIIPAVNVRHLALQQEVVDAVREGKFHLWAIDSVEEALELLTGTVWNKENDPCLLRSIQERIAQSNQQDLRQRPWPLRWLNWFNQS